MPDPVVGVKAEFRDEEAAKRAKAHEARMRHVDSVHEWLSKRQKTRADSTTKVAQSAMKKQIAYLRRLKFNLRTFQFFIGIVARAVQAAYNQMSEAAERTATRGGTRALARSYEVDLGSIIASMKAVSNQALSVADAVGAAQQAMLIDQGEFSEKYAELWEAARLAAAVGGGDATEIFEAMIESLVAGSGESLDAATNIYQVRLALQKYAEAAGTTVDALDPLVAQQIILNEIQQETNTLLAEGAGEAFEAADAFGRLAATQADYGEALKVAAGETLVMTGALATLNALLTTTYQLAILAAAGIGGLFSMAQTPGNPLQGAASRFAGSKWTLRGQDRSAPSTEDAMTAFWEGFNKVMKPASEALGMFRDPSAAGGRPRERFDETKDQKRNLTPLVDHLMKRQDLIEKNAHNVTMAERRWANRREDIWTKFYQTTARVERQAGYERGRAERSYNRRVLENTEDYLLKRAKMYQDFLREQSQREERFRAAQVQNERLYQYERGLLVAEGDVLAIEDLDARYALETQSREENQSIKQRQEQSDFTDDLQQQKLKFGLEMDQLRRAYDDQLLEIRLRMKERMLEADIQRKDALVRAKRDHDQALEDERYRHEQSLEQWNQYWAKLAERAKIGAEATTGILREFFGTGGEADTIVGDFMKRWQSRVNAFSRISRYAPVTGTGGIIDYSRENFQDLNRWGLPGMQYGGSGVARSPMLMRLGEGHTPERFSIQPEASMGAHLTISWAGGVIPVEGSGLQGADTGGLGEHIVRGLIVAIDSQLQQRRG